MIDGDIQRDRVRWGQVRRADDGGGTLHRGVNQVGHPLQRRVHRLDAPARGLDLLIVGTVPGQGSLGQREAPHGAIEQVVQLVRERGEALDGKRTIHGIRGSAGRPDGGPDGRPTSRFFVPSRL